MSHDKRRLRLALRLLSAAPAVVGVLLLSALAPLEESAGLALLFAVRGPLPPPDEVMIVGIDGDTDAALGRPIDRAHHAALVDLLARRRAKVVVFDIFMHNETVHDAVLARAIADAGNVILTARMERPDVAGLDVQVMTEPVAPIAAAALGIAPWIAPEVFRVNWAVLRDAADRPMIPLLCMQAYVLEDLLNLLREARPALAERLERSGLAEASPPLQSIMEDLSSAFASDPSLARQVSASPRTFPGLKGLSAVYSNHDVFRDNRLYLNFYGRPRTITTVPYQRALQNDFHGHEVAGRAVFVGYSARRQPEQRDDYPFVYSVDGFNLSGVEMAATTVANLLRGDYLRPPPPAVRASIVAAWGLLIGAAFRMCRVRSGFAIGLALAGVYGYAVLLAFRAGNIWLPVIVPALQFLLAGALSLRVKQLTDRVELGSAAGEEAALALTGRGQREKLDHRVVLFADEAASKKRVRRAEAQLDVAQRRALQRDIAFARDGPVAAEAGRVNHTLADSMLAFWTIADLQDSAAVARQVQAACRAALAIHARMDALSQHYPGFCIRMRIGLDYGEIASQLNPSPQIKDWRMEGVPIHVAERLESLNKCFDTATLVSDDVAALLDESLCTIELGTFIFCDESGDVVVDPVTVHELTAATSLSSDDVPRIAALRQALAALRQRDFTGATARFDALAAADFRHSAIASRYAEWCRLTLAEQEPCWDGTVMVTFSDKSQFLARHLGAIQR